MKPCAQGGSGVGQGEYSIAHIEELKARCAELVETRADVDVGHDLMKDINRLLHTRFPLPTDPGLHGWLSLVHISVQLLSNVLLLAKQQQRDESRLKIRYLTELLASQFLKIAVPEYFATVESSSSIEDSAKSISALF